MAFVDSDHVIEQRLGCSIKTFFAREGEERFRDLEQATLDELTAGTTPAVLYAVRPPEPLSEAQNLRCSVRAFRTHRALCSAVRLHIA